MKIYAKNKLDKDIYDKMRKGADAIEIHLDDNYLNESTDHEFCKTVPIRVVHAPLLKNKDATIETIEGMEALKFTCKLASKIAKLQNHSVIVVCHLETNPQVLQELGIYDALVKNVKWLVENYQNLELVIENVPQLRCVDNKIHFRHVDFMAPITLVKDINNPRVGTCLDICHALADIRFMKYVTNYMKDVEFDMNEIENGLSTYFKANKDTIKLIHLATIKEHGCVHDHGLPFDKEDEGLLKGILELYDMFGYSCPITIEVQESNYSNAVGFDKTNKMLRKLLKR
jgi:sugar phosphate isomerase/epimerase